MKNLLAIGCLSTLLLTACGNNPNTDDLKTSSTSCAFIVDVTIQEKSFTWGMYDSNLTASQCESWIDQLTRTAYSNDAQDFQVTKVTVNQLGPLVCKVNFINSTSVVEIHGTTDARQFCSTSPNTTTYHITS